MGSTGSTRVLSPTQETVQGMVTQSPAPPRSNNTIIRTGRQHAQCTRNYYTFTKMQATLSLLNYASRVLWQGLGMSYAVKCRLHMRKPGSKCKPWTSIRALHVHVYHFLHLIRAAARTLGEGCMEISGKGHHWLHKCS